MARQGEANRAESSRVSGDQEAGDGDAIARKWPTLGEVERGRIKSETLGKGGEEVTVSGPLLRRRGTGRPSVASTCCASRPHFTLRSLLPILSPPFFII